MTKSCRNRILKSILALQLSLTMPLGAYAANIGVCTHMAAPHNGNSINGILKLVSDVGSDWVRDELRWGWGMETVKGTLNMPKADWTNDAAAAGVNGLVILGYGNTIYNPGNVNDTDGIYVPTTSYKEYFDAFIEYVRFVASECKGRVKAYEIWNEPNHANFNYQIKQSRYSYTANDYFELLKAAYGAIKEIDPDAKVVGGSFLIGGTVTSGWMESLFRAGAGDYMDAFSFHVYTYDDSNPETAMRSECDGVERVLRNYNFGGEVWLTETGYYSGSAADSVSEQEQASLIIRSKIAWDNYLKDNGRKGEFFWYDLRNDGTNASSAGHNFGLATYGYAPKDGFYSTKTYNSLLEGKEFVSLTVSPDGNDYLALYEGEAEDKTDKVYIAYKKGNYSSAIDVSVSGDAAYVYDYKGNKISSDNRASEKLSLKFTDTSPVFVHCKDYETKIKDINYDSEKNICTVSGRAEDFETVTIELIRDSELVQSETAIVDDEGNFSKFFSVDSDGEYVVRVGKPEIEAKGGTRYAQQIMSMKRNGSVEAAIGITYTAEKQADGLEVSLTGSVSDGAGNQVLNLLVVPKNSEAGISNAVYIGDVRTGEGGAFETRFKIPKSTPHTYHYTLYVRGRNTALKTDDVDYTTGNGKTLVYDFTLNLDETNVFASVYAENITAETNVPVVFVAQYDENGVLVDVTAQNITLNPIDGKKQFVVSVKKDDKANIARAYIWDGVSSIVPIAPAITKPIK